jgi:hypothetical protein
MALRPDSPRIRIAAAFIYWVLGSAGFAAPFLFFHGWNEGKAFLLGGLGVGVIAFIANVIYIRVTDE